MKFSLLGLAGVLGVANAQVLRYCASSAPNICFSVYVPTSSSSGTGDLYFQIQGPSTQQWIGLGQGAQMPGANIFMVYGNADGQNVTLSPRLTSGYVMPNYNQAAQVTLLSGSGINNGTMTANVRCASCASWQGGSMNFSDPNSNWIWSIKGGSAIASSDLSTNLDIHDNQGNFNLDLTKATGGEFLNPFTDSAATTTTTDGAASSSGSSGSSSSASSSSSSGPSASQTRKLIAHGVLMSLAFLIFFPFGSLTIRLLSFKGFVWVHAAAQFFAYAIFIVGFGLGVYLARGNGIVGYTHPVIGIVVFSLMFFQPILGYIHHLFFVRSQRRTWWAVAHVWYGRALIILGAINGGLGLQLANNSTGGEIAYGVVAGVVFLVWFAVIVVRFLRGRGKSEGEKMMGSSGSVEEMGQNREM